jgi:hypothetical protein
MKALIKVIDVWIFVEKSLLKTGDPGTLLFEFHNGRYDALKQVKLLLEVQPPASSDADQEMIGDDSFFFEGDIGNK